MGIPAQTAGTVPNPVPPAHDQANAVLAGKFTAVGPSDPVMVYGAFNVAIWAETNTTLTTTAATAAATVGSSTNIVPGQAINSTLVPAGTTVLTSPGGGAITMAFPPAQPVAGVTAGADTAALFGAAPWTGTINLERSFDGGKTWLICGVGGGGQGAIYSGAALGGQPVSIVASEPEKGMLYRLNCTALTAGQPKYRISCTGLTSVVLGVPSS